MILVDTSVWVDHLRMTDPRLKRLLSQEKVLCHPFIIGELACGNLERRSEILAYLSLIPSAAVAEHDEVLHLLEQEKLYGKGLGWIDSHLLASALISKCGFWTNDRRLRSIAFSLNLAWR